MEVYTCIILQWFCRMQQRKLYVDSRRSLKRSRRGQHHAAFEFVFINSRQIERSAFTRDCFFGRSSMQLNSPHTNFLACRKKLQLVFFMDRTGNERSGDYCAESFHAEDAIKR